MYKLIIFDLDGTLIDSDLMLKTTILKLCELHKPSHLPSDEEIITFSGPPIYQTLKQLFPGENPDEMFNEWQKYSPMYYKKYVKLYPNVLKMFSKLSGRVKICVATNKTRGASNFTFELFKIDKYIDKSICGDEVSKYKPDPEGILKLVSFFGIDNKDEVIYIGDTESDGMAAKNAGVKFGYCLWSKRKLTNNIKPDENIADYLSFTEKILNETN